MSQKIPVVMMAVEFEGGIFVEILPATHVRTEKLIYRRKHGWKTLGFVADKGVCGSSYVRKDRFKTFMETTVELAGLKF